MTKPQKPQTDSGPPKVDSAAVDSGPPKTTDPGLGPRSLGAAKLEGRLSEEQWLEALRHFDRHTLPPEVRRQWMLAENPNALRENSTAQPSATQESSEPKPREPGQVEGTAEEPATTAAGSLSGSGELPTATAGAESRKSDPAATATPKEDSSAARSPFADTEKRPRDPRKRPAREPASPSWLQRLGPLVLAVFGMGATAGIFWSFAQSGSDLEEAIDAPPAVSVSMHAASPSESGLPESGRSLPDAAGATPAATLSNSVRSSADLPAQDPVPSQASSAARGAATPTPQVMKPVARPAPKPPAPPPLFPARRTATAPGDAVPCATENLPPCPPSANRRGPRTLGGVDIETPLISD